MLEFATWLEGTAPAIFVQMSDHGFQIVVGAHIMGLVFSVGTLLWLDLRLAGLALRDTSIQMLNRRLMPWFITGFVVMIASGLTLFAAYATSAIDNIFFRVKLAAIVLAGINAWAFHRMLGRNPGAWDRDPVPPVPVRVAGFVSLLSWTIAIVCGRMMSYTMF